VRHRRKILPNDCLAYLIRSASKCLTRALYARLSEHDVWFGHWMFLRILWEKDGLTQRELSIEAGVMEPTTFSALKTMEKLGYIKRRQTPDNKKNVYIHLTAKGRALKGKLMPLALDVNRVALRGASAAEITATREVLFKILENFSEDEISISGPLRVPSRQKRRQRPINLDA
jgi:DNA-binding MarR family transcriptional regulator